LRGRLSLMWACKCCQLLVQKPAAPQVKDFCRFHS
jgi:hypothetical protein